MIKIFTGDDRVRASREITKFLGQDYEVIEGTALTPSDLPSIFKGNSLFSNSRNILIRDLSESKSAFLELENYLDTPHNIIIQEIKLDKRSAAYKSIKDKVEITEFTLPKNPNLKLVFDIFATAQKDGPKSIAMLDQVKQDEDPIMFFGLLASQALKAYDKKQGTSEKTTLKSLARLDLQMKSTSTDPWLLIESFLLTLKK